MRAIIATDFRGILRKVMWLTENTTGISAGICDSAQDPHATYHVDGRFHIKVRSKGRLLTVGLEKKVPLASISTEVQLFGTSAHYSADNMERLPLFRPNRRVDVLVVLGQTVFADIGWASFNVCIIHRTHEARFVTEAYSHYEDHSFMVVAVNLFALHGFPNHQVGVITYKGRVPPNT